MYSRPIAESVFHLSFSDGEMWVRIYTPMLEPDGVTWVCPYGIDAPLSIDSRGFGESSLLALVEALRGVSRALYGSVEYMRGQIGAYDCFGGDLFFPATSDLIDIAPYPF